MKPAVIYFINFFHVAVIKLRANGKLVGKPARLTLISPVFFFSLSPPPLSALRAYPKFTAISRRRKHAVCLSRVDKIFDKTLSLLF